MGVDAGTLGLISSGISAGAGVANAYTQSRAYTAQGDFARRMGNLNASMTDLQAQDAVLRGEEEAKRLGIRTRQLIGAQRASAAAQGVSVNSGSPLQLQTDAAALSALDQATIRNNAWKEAMGLRMEGAADRFRGNMAYRMGRFQASNSLMSGGMNALGQVGTGLYNYYRYTPPMKVPTPSYDPKTEWYNPYPNGGPAGPAVYNWNDINK